uniref:Uncharacterized protein n=1 Tax=Salmonella sp. TaxID=599 RepID=A0A482EVE4_SALSP|nr:hypothetical protein [Salmonella sp.]QBM91372.1 hypothetical protein NNIBIDOC_00039 [Salmonella sp.]
MVKNEGTVQASKTMSALGRLLRLYLIAGNFFQVISSKLCSCSKILMMEIRSDGELNQRSEIGAEAKVT